MYYLYSSLTKPQNYRKIYKIELDYLILVTTFWIVSRLFKIISSCWSVLSWNDLIQLVISSISLFTLFISVFKILWRSEMVIFLNSSPRSKSNPSFFLFSSLFESYFILNSNDFISTLFIEILNFFDSLF